MSPVCDACGSWTRDPVVVSVRGDGFIYTLGYLFCYFFCCVECVPAMWRRP